MVLHLLNHNSRISTPKQVCEQDVKGRLPWKFNKVESQSQSSELLAILILRSQFDSNQALPITHLLQRVQRATLVAHDDEAVGHNKVHSRDRGATAILFEISKIALWRRGS